MDITNKKVWAALVAAGLWNSASASESSVDAAFTAWQAARVAAGDRPRITWTFRDDCHRALERGPEEAFMAGTPENAHKMTIVMIKKAVDEKIVNPVLEKINAAMEMLTNSKPKTKDAVNRLHRRLREVLSSAEDILFEMKNGER
jgi:hypothetical protein